LKKKPPYSFFLWTVFCTFYQFFASGRQNQFFFNMSENILSIKHLSAKVKNMLVQTPIFRIFSGLALDHGRNSKIYFQNFWVAIISGLTGNQS